MGKYKEKHGKTLMGDILKGIGGAAKVLGPEVLKVVGTVTGIKGLTRLGEALDKDSNVTQEMKEQIMEIAIKRIEAQIAEDIEITKRWSADMSSDSWLSKNVRPMTLIALLVFFFGIAITDSIDAIEFELDSGYKEILKVLLVTAFLAYFGGRAYNKSVKMKNK